MSEAQTLLERAFGALDLPAKWLTPLCETCETYEINNRNRVAAFLAQLLHESGNFKWVEEIWGPTRAQRRYEGRKDLGNIIAGDGQRYRGRGLIQITGRANYRSATQRLRQRFPDCPDFEVDPKLLEEPRWAALSAGDYWHHNDLNELADKQMFTSITKRINGGTNGLLERKRIWNQLLDVL